MLTVRLTDGKSFAIPFTIGNHIALHHGCRVAFRHLAAVNAERHMQSQSKLNAALREIDEWLATQLAKPGRSPLDISSLHATATKRKSDRHRGIFYGQRDPDFYLLPNSLQLHVLDQYTRIPLDPAGVRGYWIAAGTYGNTCNHSHTGANIHIWRNAVPADETRLGCPGAFNNISLAADISAWERIWNKCQAADDHARALSMLCDWVAEEATREPQPKPTSPNRAKFYLMNGGNHGR